MKKISLSNLKVTFFIVFLLFLVSLVMPTIASAMTREEVLNSIETLQLNSTENQLTANIETLLIEETAKRQTQLTVNIQDYGAKGNGVDSDVVALRNAITYLVKTAGGGNVFFPATAKTYVIDAFVVIPKDVNLIGEQTRLSRYHNYEVSHNVFEFRGNNIMEGFIYDGGLTRIPDTGLVKNEFTYYDEFYSQGCIFYNNTFLNAKGTFIGGRGNNIIYNNTFGEYGDHCAYFGGSTKADGTEDYTKRVIIVKNDFKARTSSRESVKFRNSGELVIVANNTFDLPNGKLFQFILGDDINLQGKIKDISFSYNIVKNCRSMGSVDLSNTPIGSTLGKVDNIKISNNIVDSCSGYLLIGEASWSANSNLSYFSGTNIDISNNTFNKDKLGKIPQIHLSCKGDGLKVNITNNKAYGSAVNNSFISMYGNTSLNLLDNILDFTNNTTLINSPYQNSNYTSKTAGIRATSHQTININSNTISGVRKIYQEYSDKNVTYLTDKINFILTNNTFVKRGLAIEFGIDSGLAKLIQAKSDMSNNLVTQDGNVASINNQYYPYQYLVKHLG